MQSKIKPLLSGLAICIFLLMAIASDLSAFLVESTNAMVTVSDCEDKDPFTGKLTIKIDFGPGLAGQVSGVLFIVHQIVDPDACVSQVVENLTVDFNTDINGQYTFVTNDFIHDNSQDLWRIEVKGNPNLLDPLGYRRMQVAFYNTTQLIFTNQTLPGL